MKNLHELKLEKQNLDSRIQYLLWLQTSYEGKLERVEPLSDEFERVVEELTRIPLEIKALSNERLSIMLRMCKIEMGDQ